jgi:hypothetical protein
MKSISNSGAQGDVLFRRVPSVPKTAVKRKRSGALVVAHSETGHHHSIADKAVSHFEVPGDSLVCYLRLDDGLGDLGGVDVVHHRAWDTHEAMRLLGKPGDVWEVRRQREWTPEGWRRVED